MITEEQILFALGHVEEPDLKKDLVTLKMIEGIVIRDNKVSFSVILTTPACPLKALIENACRNAIAHFVSKEIEVSINMTSRVTVQKNQPLQNIKNIIVVASGKGGVGKSTVAVNLALGLSKTGAKVGLIDADIYGPSIPIMFGLEGARPQSVQGNDGKTRIHPIEKFGIKLLSIGFFTDPNQPVPWRGPMVSTAVKQLFNDADWGELDYMIVDLPPGTGDIHITLTQTYPVAGAVIVTTPQNVALSDAKKGIGMFMMNAINVPLLGIIENMAYFTPAELPDNRYYIFGKDGGKRLAEQFDAPFLGEIPLVKGISDAGDSGYPVVLEENDPMAAAFMDIAKKVAQQVAIANATEKTDGSCKLEFSYLYKKELIMDLFQKVDEALNSIRPYLEADGGNVSVEEITADNIVRLKLHGACGSCPMSIMTLKAGIEEAIKKAVPEIISVEAINLTDIDDPNAVMPGQLT